MRGTGVELIGTIVCLQVQRSSLKLGERPRRWFDPSPLVSVISLEVDQAGVIGVTEDGERIVDVHNRNHPASRYGNANGMSLGFTSHYARMRTVLGERAVGWVAGENVIVQTEREFCQDDLPRNLTIESADGPLRLEGIRPIEPCVEFSRYLLGFSSPPSDDVTIPNPAVTTTIASLRQGVRGYCVSYAGGAQVLRLGDRLISL
jgi:hypothetical protein